MDSNRSVWLLGSTIWLILMAIVAALVSAQWKAEQLPFVALGVILLLALFKARIVVADFMGLGGVHPKLAAALIAWPAGFALLAAAKAALQAFAIS